MVWLLDGKYTGYLSYLNSFIICKNLKGIKVEKAKKWNVNIVNGSWLSELYLGNTYALAKPLDERYKNVINSESNGDSSSAQALNHLGFDPVLVNDFLQLWKNELPLEAPLPLQQLSGNSNKFQNASLKRHLSTEKNESDTNADDSSSSSKVLKTSINSISWSKPQLNIPCIMFTGIDPTKVAQYQKVKFLKF